MSVATAASESPAESRCQHCGSSLLRAVGEEPTPDARFCCAGCASVWEVLHASGLGRYYALREQRPGRPVGTIPTRRWDATSLAQASRDGGAALCFAVEGIHCGSCGWLLEWIAEHQPGVASARVNLADERLTVRLRDDAHPGEVAPGISEALSRAGYACRPASDDEARRTAEHRMALLRLGVAAAAAMNLMLLAVSMYGGDRFGMDWADRRWFRGLSCLIAVPGVLWPAWPVLDRAARAVRGAHLHVDVPLAIGIVVMMVASVVNVVRGEGELWFDSAAMLVALLLGGRFVESSLRRRAAGRLRAMVGRRVPRGRRRVPGSAPGMAEEVDADMLRVGDRLDLLPGDIVPADVVVEEGASDVDCAVVDGESRPRFFQAGDRLVSGARVLDGVLVARVVADAGESALAQLRAAVDRALTQRHKTELLADRVARGFVAAVLGLAAIAVILWWHAGPERALDVGVAVLVVACPCALALATPLVFAATVHAALGRGVVVRDGGVILDLHDVRRVVFDRTGTLTEGTLRPANLHLGEGYDSDEVLRLAAAVARASRHPVSRAVVLAARERGLDSLPLAVDVKEVAGEAIEGRVRGRLVRIGRPGATIHIDGCWVAELDLLDAPRPGAGRAVSDLRALGLRISLLSGDRKERAEALARSLGIQDAEGALWPEEKAEHIRRWQAGGEPCLFVGDGLNDGPALAGAFVGLTMGRGADLAVEAGRGVLIDDDPAALADLIRLARRARLVLLTNLAFSAFYNLVAVGLAIAGVVTPLVAASLMPFGSLVVVARAARLSTYLRNPPAKP